MPREAESPAYKPVLALHQASRFYALPPLFYALPPLSFRWQHAPWVIQHYIFRTRYRLGSIMAGSNPGNA
jgi:hypothetical protein